jgi:hypothetical protein
MLKRLLYFIAGVDPQVIASCPPTDRIWAAQIGFSLCLSFLVVSGVSYYALGYIVSGTILRTCIAAVIALTVMMFDRALFQSDWFVQGAFWLDDDRPRGTREAVTRSLWQFVRVGARLAISLGLAWVIALFLELALFSDAITQRIERDRVANNRPVFEQIDRYAADIDRDINNRRAELAAAEQQQRQILAEVPSTPPGARSIDDEQEMKALTERERGVREEVRALEETIRQQSADMNAEEFGERLSPANSGRAGIGRRYEFAKKQKDAADVLLQSRQAELSQIAARRQMLRSDQAARIAAEISRREKDQQDYAAKREAIQGQVDVARESLQRLESARNGRLQKYREQALESSFVQQRKDGGDPLVRLSAYQALKADPGEGQTIILFSWMIRFFVIFLEIVPVITKIFFSPPSMYAVHVQAQIRAARIAARSATWRLPEDVAQGQATGNERAPSRKEAPGPAWLKWGPSPARMQPDVSTKVLKKFGGPDEQRPIADEPSEPAPSETPPDPAPARRWSIPVRRSKQPGRASTGPNVDDSDASGVVEASQMPERLDEMPAFEVAEAPVATAAPPENAERVVVVYNGGGMRDVGAGHQLMSEPETVAPRRAREDLGW